MAHGNICNQRATKRAKKRGPNWTTYRSTTMKIGKDDIQKIGLGLLLLLGLIYGYFAFLLTPLKQRQSAADKSIAALAPEIAAARAQIRATQTLEQKAPAAQAVVAQVNAMIPEGSPVAWFPPRLAEFFKSHGVARVATRLNNEAAEKQLPGFRRLSWGVDLPKVEFARFAEALADLENEEPLLES